MHTEKSHPFRISLAIVDNFSLRELLVSQCRVPKRFSKYHHIKTVLDVDAKKSEVVKELGEKYFMDYRSKDCGKEKNHSILNISLMISYVVDIPCC